MNALMTYVFLAWAFACLFGILLTGVYLLLFAIENCRSVKWMQKCEYCYRDREFAVEVTIGESVAEVVHVCGVCHNGLLEFHAVREVS